MLQFTQYTKIKFVTINSQYCNFLRTFDSRVPYNADAKKLRPFIGILFRVHDIDYFAPLSSPKTKHRRMNDTIDFMKIDHGELGAINFNNMIPVTPANYQEIPLNKVPDDMKEYFRYELLKNQLRWLNKHKEKVYKKSLLLYHLYKEDKLSLRVRNRCCNYLVLEEKCLEYNKEMVEI